MKGDGECKLLNHQSCHAEYHISLRRVMNSVLRYAGKQRLSFWHVWHFAQLCLAPLVLISTGALSISFLQGTIQRVFHVLLVCFRGYMCVNESVCRNVGQLPSDDSTKTKTLILFFSVEKGGQKVFALSLIVNRH